MFKKIIPFLEMSTALAAVCLVAFQVYKIMEDKKTKEEWFNTSVNKAIDEIVTTMEKNEVIFSMTSFDTTKQNFMLRKTKYNIQIHRKNQEVFDVNILDTNTFSKSRIPVDNHTALDLLHTTFVELANNRKYDDSSRIHRRVVINNIIQSIITFETPMEERIEQTKLENLISDILRHHGIELDFTYEVRGENGCLLFASSMPITEKIFSRRLFPSDAFAEPYMLRLSFSAQNIYILKAIGAMVFVSLLLLIAVIGIFFTTMREIFKQKRISQIRSDFVSNMTHELKTPITSIMLASEMQKTLGSSGNVTSINLAQTINSEAKKLLLLVEQVLQIAQFEKGKFRLNPFVLDAHDAIKYAANAMVMQAHDKNAQIILNLNATKYNIMADELHFTNIISNLIDNSLKYSSAQPVITIATSNEHSSLVINIIDNGIGMTEDAQKHIFEQFYRASTGNLHDVKGFGLGLNYVKNVVERHKGTIKVKSKIGNGSIFTIVLPLC